VADINIAGLLFLAIQLCLKSSRVSGPVRGVNLVLFGLKGIYFIKYGDDLFINSAQVLQRFINGTYLVLKR
jgi:hypothetical protein